VNGKFNAFRFGLVTIAALALVLAGTLGAATVRLRVQPGSVARGGTVSVSGTGCRAGDLVYLISPPFKGNAFVQHSVATRAHSTGNFARSVRIRTSVRPGRYLITARCGGGNLGVSARLRVY
jgi:hypothetical protein